MRQYAGMHVALGTMHAKERAIAPPFMRMLGAKIVLPSRIDTDSFGTFTGEVERKGTMLEAARAKARLAMDVTGLPFGVASEGSYGPHTHLPFLSGGIELLLFIDDERGIEVSHAQPAARTNYDVVAVKPGEDVTSALSRMKFPAHAVTLRANQTTERDHGERGALATVNGLFPEPPLFKGLTSVNGVIDAIRICAASSSDGKALLVPDMRAHHNPTRMRVIRAAATRLVRRIASECPECGLPGFGIVDVERGLPCSDCGAPTSLVTAEIHRCTRCSFESRKPLRERQFARPGQCEHCNP